MLKTGACHELLTMFLHLGSLISLSSTILSRFVALSFVCLAPPHWHTMPEVIIIGWFLFKLRRMALLTSIKGGGFSGVAMAVRRLTALCPRWLDRADRA